MNPEYGNVIDHSDHTAYRIFLCDSALSTGINFISGQVPSKYKLSQNYPNPFNPLTKIKFELPFTGFVKLVMFDNMGREVKTLVNDNLAAGSYESSFDGSRFASGVYFYKLQAGDFIETKKMILVK